MPEPIDNTNENEPENHKETAPSADNQENIPDREDDTGLEQAGGDNQEPSLDAGGNGEPAGEVKTPPSAEVKKTKDTPARSTGHGPSRKGERLMLARYGKMGHLGFFRHSEREIPPTLTHAVVYSERGLEIAQILCSFFHRRGTCAIPRDKIDNYCRISGGNYTISKEGQFVRFATNQDLNEQRHLDQEGKEEGRYCQELIEKHQLQMRLVDVEHLFGGDRIIYYFMADGRVDFRQLVKDLAQRYQTRIEMRQIGARDEARLIADYETCGRECCCKNFLKILHPVSMRMAKLQKATLDPSKISGRCGRLKCCLRYEDEVYTELCKRLPKTNSWIQTEQGVGQVLETQVLTQLVKVRLQAGRIIAIREDEILQRDVKPPPVSKAESTEPREEVQPESIIPTILPVEEDVDPPEDSTEQTEGKESVSKKRRRRRRRKKKKDNE